MSSVLQLSVSSPLQALVGGIQLSQNGARHQDRIIDCFDLIFVCEGAVPIQEEDQSYELTAGQTLLLWPHRHHWGTGEFALDTRLYWLHFTCDTCDQPAQQDEISDCETSDNADDFSVPQHACVVRPEVLETLFRRFIDDQKTGRLLPGAANLMLCLILQEVADQRPLDSFGEAAGSNPEALAGRALAYIHAYFHMPLTVAQTSEHLGYNADYLNRVFRQTYQRTLLEELHRTRIDHAHHLLLHSSKDLKDISVSCGFNDVSYFCRLFKRYKGLTPTAFRRIHKAESPVAR